MRELIGVIDKMTALLDVGGVCPRGDVSTTAILGLLADADPVVQAKAREALESAVVRHTKWSEKQLRISVAHELLWAGESYRSGVGRLADLDLQTSDSMAQLRQSAADPRAAGRLRIERLRVETVRNAIAALGRRPGRRRKGEPAGSRAEHVHAVFEELGIACGGERAGDGGVGATEGFLKREGLDAGMRAWMRDFYASVGG